MYQEKKLTIQHWAEEDRPREKMMLKGRQSLSDAELLAILLGSGTRGESALELAKRMLSGSGHRLDLFGKASLTELMRFKGVGEAKAITIAAALELGRRRRDEVIVENQSLNSSHLVFSLVRPDLQDLTHEEFWVLFLNRANHLIAKSRISAGGLTGTVVDQRILFKQAIQHLASSVILVHNHPSGNLRPSDADITLTKKLKESGKIMDIAVLDHLIVSDNNYFSFADEGIL